MSIMNVFYNPYTIPTTPTNNHDDFSFTASNAWFLAVSKEPSFWKQKKQEMFEVPKMEIIEL